MAIFAFTAFSRYFARKKFGMRLDRGTRLALVAVCFMLGSGFAVIAGHTFVEQKFDQVIYLSRLLFLIGIVLAAIATMISLSGTNLAFLGYLCIILAVITAFFITSTVIKWNVGLYYMVENPTRSTFSLY
ncbi:MAG: hypothetical protein ACREBI_08415 [Nitrosotalea sp.]